MKKTIYSNDLQQFKNTAAKINHLIRTGNWVELAENKRGAYKDSLVRLFNKLKNIFSIRSSKRILGAAIILISNQVSAQVFGPVEVNPFNTSNNGAYIHLPTFVDIDNDGDLDLLTTDEDGFSFIYQENIGTVNSPDFADPISNPFGLLPSYYVYTPKHVDLDNDGDYDIVASGYYGILIYFENIGTPESPNFDAEVEDLYDLDLEFTFLTDFVDIDGDGDFDMFVNRVDVDTYDGSFVYYENTGTPELANFGEDLINPFGLNAEAGYLFMFGDFADLDLDGDLDLIRAEFYGDRAYYHENIGTADSPNFALGDGVGSPFGLSRIVYAVGATFADIDGDGDQDVFISDYYGALHYFENIEFNLGIGSDNDQFSFEVYPNPSSDFISIQYDADKIELKELQIISIDGKSLQKRTSDFKSPLNISSLPLGIYIIQLKTDDKKTIQKEFVKH